MTRHWLIGAAVAALAGAGIAMAQTSPATAPHRGHMMKTETRAEVQARIAKFFAKVDANRDGFVTKAEADAAMAQRTAKFAGQGAKPGQRFDRGAMFDRLDANHDGALSRAEFDAAAGRMHARIERAGLHPGFAGRMFETADVNKDGRLSLAEAEQAALQHFDRADLNHDGQLTPEERRQARRALRAQRKPG